MIILAPSQISLDLAKKTYEKNFENRDSSFEAFQDTVKDLIIEEGWEVSQVLRIFGQNSQQFKGYNPSFNKDVKNWFQDQMKPHLAEVLEQGNSSINKLQEILTIYYLRHLQQEEWEEQNNYISYDRIKSEFGAEDYNYDRLPILTINHYLNYEHIDLADYRKEIGAIRDQVINNWNKENLSDSLLIERLQEYAKNREYLETFIESPDRLEKMPQHYDESHSAGWGRKEQRGAVRFAPTPNGPLHIGHGRGISLLADYADKYNMKFLLRFDDTNQDDESKSSNLPEEFQIDDVYEHIKDDVKWIIGRTPDKVVYSSDEENLKRYEDAARLLIKNKFAFVLFATLDNDEPYRYGRTVNENLDMFDEMLVAGPTPDKFSRASVILGVGADYNNSGRLYTRTTPQESKRNHIRRVKTTVREFIEREIYGGRITNNKLESLNNAGTGSKFMGNQEVENIRVVARGDEQWAWPNLSLQSVIDDAYYGVTHALRGEEYDIAVAVATLNNKKESAEAKVKAGGILHTIYFQGVLRMLLGYPPVYTASNWGNVSWDGWIWDYEKPKSKRHPTTGEKIQIPAFFKNEKTPNMSTSIMKLGILDKDRVLYDDGFLTATLPTIYNLRNNPKNRGSSFRFYWTRFDLPNIESPTFETGVYDALNEELKEAFPGEEGERRLIDKNRAVTTRIEQVQENRKYLAENYSSSE